jgi:hypothetical protein
MKKINKQIEENPLTKEERRTQFIENTEKMGIKHSFTFDEAWEIGELIRKKYEYREKIIEFEKQLLSMDGALVGKELDKVNPLKHSFADGCYIREIFIPANTLVISKIHKIAHPFFLVEGEVSILTEDGVVHLKAPHNSITLAGTKRVLYTHTNCRFITVHVTGSTDLQEIENEVIAKDFSDEEISLENIELLKKEITLKKEGGELLPHP